MNLTATRTTTADLTIIERQLPDGSWEQIAQFVDNSATVQIDVENGQVIKAVNPSTVQGGKLEGDEIVIRLPQSRPEIVLSLPS